MALRKISLPNQSVELDGFWAPEGEGEVLHGVLIKHITNINPTFFAIELLEDTMIQSRIQNEEGEFKKDKEGEFISETVNAEKGSIVGLGRSNNLEGLEGYIGHEIRIVFLGKIKTKTKGRSVKKFDVEASEKPVTHFMRLPETHQKLGEMLDKTNPQTS